MALRFARLWKRRPPALGSLERAATVFGAGRSHGDRAREPGPAVTRTRVELVHIAEHREHWLRFGRAASEAIIDRRRRALWFEPGAIFAFVRWQANDHGTVVSRVDILAAARPGEQVTTVPGVAPGGVALLRLSGWPLVARVLAAIDQIEALGVEPDEACPDHWRQIHNRLTAGGAPRPYTAERHRAWLMRRDRLA